MTTKNLSLAAFVCGILGIVGGFIPVIQNITLILAIAAVVLAGKCVQAGGATADELKKAKIGKILGIIGIVEWVLVILFTVVLIGALM